MVAWARTVGVSCFPICSHTMTGMASYLVGLADPTEGFGILGNLPANASVVTDHYCPIQARCARWRSCNICDLSKLSDLEPRKLILRSLDRGRPQLSFCYWAGLDLTEKFGHQCSRSVGLCCIIYWVLVAGLWLAVRGHSAWCICIVAEV